MNHWTSLLDPAQSRRGDSTAIHSRRGWCPRIDPRPIMDRATNPRRTDHGQRRRGRTARRPAPPHPPAATPPPAGVIATAITSVSPRSATFRGAITGRACTAAVALGIPLQTSRSLLHSGARGVSRGSAWTGQNVPTGSCARRAIWSPTTYTDAIYRTVTAVGT